MRAVDDLGDRVVVRWTLMRCQLGCFCPHEATDGSLDKLRLRSSYGSEFAPLSSSCCARTTQAGEAVHSVSEGSGAVMVVAVLGVGKNLSELSL